METKNCENCKNPFKLKDPAWTLCAYCLKKRTRARAKFKRRQKSPEEYAKYLHKKTKKLPAKNRKKSAIIEALLSKTDALRLSPGQEPAVTSPSGKRCVTWLRPKRPGD
jgi:uncharacterized Zn finger protein (UPF0148 family)